MTANSLLPHPDWNTLGASWELTLQAESFSKNSIDTNLAGLRKLRDWATEHRDGAGPTDLARADARSWVAWLLETGAASSARRRFDTAKKFYAWCLEEGEADESPFDGLKGPVPNEPETPTVKVDQIKALREVCGGKSLRDRRDRAMIDVFFDCGLRLAENVRLDVEDVDLRERVLFVVGKGSRRRGPKRRAVGFGIQTARSLDRYLRERRKVQGVDPEHGPLWLGPSGTRYTTQSVKSMIKTRGASVGIEGLHPHVLRHTWASAGRKAGMSDGDMAFMGGWSSRAMLDRYGKVEAEERALEAYRGRSVLDHL